jgi:hypothetical protein
MAGNEGHDGIGQLLVEFDGGTSEAHRRGKSIILPLLQLLGHDIDADLIVLKAGQGQKHRPLTQEWNKLLEHGVGSSRDEGDDETGMARK